MKKKAKKKKPTKVQKLAGLVRSLELNNRQLSDVLHRTRGQVLGLESAIQLSRPAPQH